MAARRINPRVARGTSLRMARSKWQRGLIIVSLIFAGEAIFTLPYHITRFFRPTFLEVFQLSATELGVAQSAYGFIAMAAYFFGGPLADRFEPRKLLAGSLWATALGGLYLATFPDVTGCLLYTSPSPRDGLLSRMPSSA